MNETIKSFLNQDASNISTTQLLIIIFGCLASAVIFIFNAKYCFKTEKKLGCSAYTALKIALIAIPLSVFTVLSMFEINIPQPIIIIVTAVICIGVIIWNIFSFGVFTGIRFSFLHLTSGIIAGVSIAALVFGVIIFVILFFFGAFSITDSGGTASGGIPHTVRDVNSGESFHVIEMNGTLYLDSGGRSGVLRPSDYAGRYIDDSGNDYIAV